MAGAIQLSEVDFDQIKQNLIDYLKSTGKFTDYDFGGSNLQVILNLIAYQAQLNAYSTNMVANESFLASASIRNNVVANARQVGFRPTSARASIALIDIEYQLDTADYPSGLPRFIQLQPGMVFIANAGETVMFNCIEPQTAGVSATGFAKFKNVAVYEGTLLTAKYTKDENDYNQRFILPNNNIDTSSIRVSVQEDPNQEISFQYVEAENLVKLKGDSRVFWAEEVNDGQYELTFGDGLFGKALKDGAKISISYLKTRGEQGNGVQTGGGINFVGRTVDSYGSVVTMKPNVSSDSPTEGGMDAETVDSIKFRAPRTLASQNRAVVSEDYETIIRSIYPAIDDIHVYGGDELDIPQYGRVFIAIKPTTGDALSPFTKNFIKKSLDQYRIASIDVNIVDPEVIYVECVTTVLYDNKATGKDASSIAAAVTNVLSGYEETYNISRFGGAIRYSRIVAAVDAADSAINRNNTTLRMRRNLPASIGTAASYELCFENAFRIDTENSVVYSTGFQMLTNGVNDNRTYYFEDDTKGGLYLFYFDQTGQKVITDTKFGTVDYTKGEILIGYSTPVTFVNTSVDRNVVEVRAWPAGQDVIAKRSTSVNLSVAKSDIVALVDTATS